MNYDTEQAVTAAFHAATEVARVLREAVENRQEFAFIVEARGVEGEAAGGAHRGGRTRRRGEVPRPRVAPPDRGGQAGSGGELPLPPECPARGFCVSPRAAWRCGGACRGLLLHALPDTEKGSVVVERPRALTGVAP